MEGGFSDPSIVRNAILTLMNQGSGHHDANTFLVGFESADETWQVLLHVLQEALQGLVQQEQQQQHEQVAFFASNLLYSKIFKYWKSIPLATRPELGSTVTILLAAIAQGAVPAGKAITNRLALAAIAVAIRTSIGSVSGLARQALSWGETGTSEELGVSLELLMLLPTEVEAADVSRAEKSELQGKDLTASLPGVLRLVSLVLAQDSSSDSSSSSSSGDGGGVDSGSPSSGSPATGVGKHRSSALACAGAWFGGSLPGLGLGSLADGSAGPEGQALLVQLCGFLNGSCGPSLAAASAHALASLISGDDGFDADSPNRQAAAHALRDALLSTRPLLTACATVVASSGDGNGSSGISESEAEECTHAIAVLSCAYASAELEQLCHVATATPSDLEYMTFLLQLTGHPYRRVALLMQDVWLELGDMRIADRAPSLREPFALQLFDVLLQQCTYPRDFAGDWDDISSPGVDEAVFHELRGGVSGTAGTHDCLSTSFFVLKHHALLRLAPPLGLVVHAPATAEHGGTAEIAAQAAAVGALLVPSGGGIPPGSGGMPSWAEAEAALWALGAVAKDAVRVLTSPLSLEAADASAAVQQRVVQQQALGSTLMGLLQHVVLSESPPAQLLRTHPLLLKSAAVALGKFHPLLKAAPRPMHTLGMERQRHDVKAFAAQCAQHLSASAAAHLGGGGGGGALPEAPALLPGALALFLTALQQPVATEAAAKGLKSVCAGAPSEVALLLVQSGGTTLDGVLSASAAAGGAQGDREALVEASVRVAAHLVTDPATASAAGLVPHGASSSSAAAAGAGGAVRSSSASDGSGGHGAAAYAGGWVLRFCAPMLGSLERRETEPVPQIVEALNLLGVAVKYLDLPLLTVSSGDGATLSNGTTDHVATPLLQALLPLLDALTQSPRLSSDPEVAAATFRCFGKVFLNLTPLVAPQLHVLTSLIVRAFEAHQWPACLDCTSTAMEAFGDQPTTIGAFHGLLRHMSQVAVAKLTAPDRAGPAQDPQLVRALFNCAKVALVFVPDALLLEDPSTASASSHSPATAAPNSLLATLIALAAASAAACIHERDALRACLAFLSAVFGLRDAGPGAAGQLSPAEVDNLLLPPASMNGEQIVASLVYALCGGAASVLRDPLVECLAVVLLSLGLDTSHPVGHATHGWFVSALSTGGAVQSLDPTFRTRVLEAAVAYTNASANQRARALAVLAGEVSGEGAAAAIGGGGRPTYGGSAVAASGDRRGTLKRKLKIVLRDLAIVVAGEANEQDCIYDLNDA